MIGTQKLLLHPQRGIKLRWHVSRVETGMHALEPLFYYFRSFFKVSRCLNFLVFLYSLELFFFFFASNPWR